MAGPSEPSGEAKAVLRLLKDYHNVLLVGAPATGKTRLLNEVARWFKEPGTRPVYERGSQVPLPAQNTVADDSWLPSPERNKREVFRTTFHQGTKYRDFLRGLTPATGTPVGFMWTEGTLFRACGVGATNDGAALVVIDELNRGPAVQVFGDAIGAIETDKRLAPNGDARPETQYFELPDGSGEMQPFAIPHHVYLVAGMNQADTSVEPLDVAFLRRWEPHELQPDGAVLASYFGVADISAALPTTAASPADAYRAAIQAWNAINRRIALGRGPEYQLGHGIFMKDASPPNSTKEEAVAFLRKPWRRIVTHIGEVFFGDTRSIAAVLGAGAAGHPLTLEETTFGEAPVERLAGPLDGTGDLYALLKAVSAEE